MQFNLNLTGNNSRPMLIAIAFSTLVCALIGGKAHQTICSLAWETRSKVWGFRAAFLSVVRVVMDTLEDQHCRKAHLYYLKLTKRKDNE